jgi:kynurenine formamidase
MPILGVVTRSLRLRSTSVLATTAIPMARTSCRESTTLLPLVRRRHPYGRVWPYRYRWQASSWRTDQEGDPLPGAIQYGVETIPPIATRGILLDICRLKRVDALDSDYEITREDIDAACARQSTEIRPGDVVITHTGLLKEIENKRSYQAGGEGAQNLDSEAGIGLSAAKYLVEEKGVVVVGADNWALEVIPAPESGMFLPLHEYLLVRKGVHIMENVWTKDLARDQIYEFLFVVAGPKLGGAVQMPIHPIAIC